METTKDYRARSEQAVKDAFDPVTIGNTIQLSATRKRFVRLIDHTGHIVFEGWV